MAIHKYAVPVLAAMAFVPAHAFGNEPPKVVVRTRGRSASRAAGPADAVDSTESHPDLHVPIKKKGARKH